MTTMSEFRELLKSRVHDKRNKNQPIGETIEEAMDEVIVELAEVIKTKPAKKGKKNANS